MFEVIVFTQKELIEAIQDGIMHIGLCDNAFEIPNKPGVSYVALGDIDVKTTVTKEKAEFLGIKFKNFKPEFGKDSEIENNAERRINSFLSCIHKNSELFEGVHVNGYGINLI